MPWNQAPQGPPQEPLRAIGRGAYGTGTEATSSYERGGVTANIIGAFHALEDRNAVGGSSDVLFPEDPGTLSDPLLEEFRQVQLQNQEHRQRRKGKGKDKGQGKGINHVWHQGPLVDLIGQTPAAYEGNGIPTCAICQQNFQANEHCLRIACSHRFHQFCWIDLMINSVGDVQCPVCRSAGRVIAQWTITRDELQHQQPSQSSGSGDPGFVHINHTAVAMRMSPPETSSFLSSTSLPDGQPAILVDPGAFENLACRKWVQEMQTLAAAAGYHATAEPLGTPQQFSGVGAGNISASWKVDMPVATKAPYGSSNIVGCFQAPIIDDRNSEIPALLGLKSMRAKEGVLEMKGGKELLTFPGPGGYEIKWSPGTIHHKLVQAPSGHLVIPCGNFVHTSSAEAQGGVIPPVSVLTVGADSVGAAVSTEEPPHHHARETLESPVMMSE